MQNKIENFRFWCHKILPLVYEDSLSYYELLCRVMKKLNEIINQMNDIDLSELYNLIKALMEIDNGGEYKFEGGTTYNPEKYYGRYDYTIYNNELYRCTGGTVTGEFDPTKWYKTSISNEIKMNFFKTTQIMYGGFFTYYPLLTDHMSDELKRYYKDMVGFDNNDFENYEFLLKDCNAFPPNSVVLNVGKDFRNAPQRNNEYEDENNYVENYTIITFGGAPNNQQLDQFGLGALDYYDGYSVQIAIPISAKYGIMDDRTAFEPRILWRKSGVNETDVEEGTNAYPWENWTHHSFANYKDIEDIFRVCGVPQHLYDGRNVYPKDSYCVRMEYSGAMKMYKALRETTGEGEDEKTRKRSFIADDWQETNIIDELGGGTVVISEPENTFNQEVNSSLTESVGE